MQIAATLLLVVGLVGSWLVIRGGLDPERSTPQFAAGSPSAGKTIPAGGDADQERFVSNPVRWELPGTTDRVTLSLREIALEPGAEWVREQVGATQIWVRSGELTLSTGAGGSPTIVMSGEGVSYSEYGRIVLANQGSEPVVMTEGIVVAGPPDGPLVSDVPDGVSVTVLATGLVSASGTVEITLYAESAQAGGSEYVQNGARLVSVTDGSLVVTRLGGEIDILRGITPGGLAESETPETLGDPITLESGDAFLAHPGSGYRVEAAGDGTNSIVALAIVPVPPVDKPVASPFADTASAQGELIEVRPGDCTIEPRPIEAFEAILSDPFAEGTPQSGMRDQAGTGVAADQETIDGVTDTVRQIVACNAPGTHLEMYSLYSENMLRFHAAAGSMTIADITGLDQLATPASVSPVSGFIAVENVVIFPDGRAGAMVNANGELAYLTFVFEDGRWLIDFWDDQLDGPEATPGA
jgi:hypothetical protein